MRDQQLDLMDQPTVFGHEPYYQTGYSKIWINTTTMALRNDFTDALIWRWLTVDASINYKYGIDLLAWVTPLQANFGVEQVELGLFEFRAFGNCFFDERADGRHRSSLESVERASSG